MCVCSLNETYHICLLNSTVYAFLFIVESLKDTILECKVMLHETDLGQGLEMKEKDCSACCPSQLSKHSTVIHN